MLRDLCPEIRELEEEKFSNEEIELLVQGFGGFIAESGCENAPHAIRQTSIL